jgi:signal transduction histidine kinase
MMSTKSIDKDQIRLLVVDDLEINRNLISKQLAKHGYTVIQAESGSEALEIVETEKIDLILLDIRMPGMDGIEVLRRIRKTHSALNLPVIMVTAEALTEVTVEALQAGANDYLTKPINVVDAVARIESQLNLANMAAIKDDVVHFASHDLKKPLITMLDIAQVLRDELQTGQTTPEDSLELLDMLIKTGDNMQDVISGFLDQEVLRQDREERNFKPLDLNKIILRSMTSNADYAARKEINLNHQLTPDLPQVAANEFRLLQILDNLIGNAMKFCPGGSTVEVCTRLENNEVVAEVTDNGPGLTDEDFPKLFTKHAKLSNQPTGGEISSGVGLALCKQLIKLDEGTINARNNPGGGATFWISLPAG